MSAGTDVTATPPDREALLALKRRPNRGHLSKGGE